MGRATVARVGDAPDLTLRYADHEDGVIDLHLPPGHPLPDRQLDPAGGTSERWVVLVHGGFWRTRYDRAHTREMARALAEEGFAVATPEYRRVGPGSYGGWPTTGADVRTAVERLPSLAAAAGVPMGAAGPPLAIGHSAGGHLVLWLATTGVPLAKVVALAPVCDLEQAIARRLGSDAARDFLGSVDAAAADPMSLFDGACVPPVEIVHGVDDYTVPVDLSRGFVHRHPQVRLTEVPGGHFEPITPGSVAWPAVLSALDPARDS